MKVYNRRRGLEMGGLMRIRKSNGKHLSDSSVNHKQKKSLIAQVEQDHLGDSFIYRVRSNIANMLHIGRSRRTRHAGSVVRVLVITLVMLLTLSQAGPFFADLSGGSISNVSANAEPMNRTGVGKVSSANVRSQTTFGNNIIGSITKGTPVRVISRLKGEYASSYFSDIWYQIEYTSGGSNVSGFILGNLIMLDPIDPSLMHADFEAYLNMNGFPESYKPYLRELHRKYPNWVFDAYHTNFDWKTVIDNEDIIITNKTLNVVTTKNVIESYFNDSWKATTSYVNSNGIEQIYNWLTDTWTSRDGSGWFAATRDLISYYIDPRNALVPDANGKDSSIFQFLRLDRYNVNSGENSAGVLRVLNNSFMNNTTFADAFISAAQMTINPNTGFGINPYHLASRSRIELGSKGSPSVSGTFSADRIAAGINIADDRNYDGYYNFYNIGAYDDTTRAYENIKNGLRFAKDGNGTDNAKYIIPWNTRERAIAGGANYIKEKFIDVYQHTVYYQKFNVINNVDGTSYFWHQYMSAVMAPNSESKFLHSAYEAAGTMANATLYFSIPIYLNMPDAPSPLPAQSGNPNNWIRSLNINGMNTTPSFNPAVASGYGMIVEGEVNVAKVSIALASKKSKASINGVAGLSADIPLNVGRNVIQISVTAENGSVRVYEIEIVRKDPGEIPILLSQNLSIDQQHVSGVTVANTAGALKQQLQSSRPEYQIAIVRPNGTPYSDDELVGTGAIVQFMLNGFQSSSQYTIIIFGDVDGDADINIADVTNVFRHVMQREQLTSNTIVASDVNKDGEVDIADVSIIFRHVMGRETLVQ